MKKKILLGAVLLFIAACDKGGNFSTASLNATTGDYFSELMVKWNGAVSPSKVTVETKIDNAKHLDLTIKGYENFEELTNECSGTVEISDEDYQNILALINSSNLYKYEPPAISDEKCEALIGTEGVTVSYIRSDKTNNQFTTICTLDEKVAVLIDAVDMLAEKYVTDCTWDMVAGSLSENPEEGSY